MFGIGSRSAQTFNESAQNSNKGGGGYDDGDIQGKIHALVGQGDRPVTVCHMWRKVSKGALIHHSQIFVYGGAMNSLLLNFGLWMGDDDEAVFDTDEGKNVRWYKLSDSYSPNPMTVAPSRLERAFTDTQVKCGPNYKLLHNNCQKFGRLLMTDLGAKHTRSLFHF